MTDDIIKKIMDIDKTFYKEKFTFEWYRKRNDEENILFCLYDKNELVGYSAVSGIKEKLYNEIKSGKYKNDYKFDYKMFDKDSPFKYLSSINILEDYRKKGFGTKLLNKTLRYFKKYNIIALTVSRGGYALLNKKMKLIKQVSSDVSVFEN